MLLIRRLGLLPAVVCLAGFDSCFDESKKLPTTWYCTAQCQPHETTQCQPEGGVGVNKDKAEAQRLAERAARRRAAPCDMKGCDVSCEERTN